MSTHTPQYPEQPNPHPTQSFPGHVSQPYPPEGQPGGQPQVPPGFNPYFAAPQPPKKKGGAGKVVLIVLGVIAAMCIGGIAVAAIAVGGQSKDAKPAGTAAGASAAAPAKPKGVGLNQPARDGKFEFVVKSVTCGKVRVGDDMLGKDAQGVFCLAVVSAKNIGTSAQMLTGSSQRATDAKGNTYSHDGEAEIYVNSNAQMFLNTINPGNTVTGTLVFDVPKGTKIVSLELHDSSFSGGVTVTVG